MATVLFDLRDVIRGLRRDRMYVVTVVLTLALTIGAATAVFSIVDGVLLKPLAYRESHRLVSLEEVWRQFSNRFGTLEVNERHFEYWRTHAKTFEAMTQAIVLPANLTGVGDATQIPVGRVSGSLFEVLQVQAAIGRTLNPSDEPSDRPETAVITDACWRQRFSADPAILGRTMTIDGKPRTIVGVLGADFRLPTERLAAVAEAFVPIHTDASRVGWAGDHNNEAFGRLRSGVTVEQARAELDVLQAQVSDLATKQAGEPVTLTSVVAPLAETVVGQSRRGLLLLLGAIVSVLLIACCNLANLSLTRAVGRMRDSAIRTALGADRKRLMTRAIGEQLLLSCAGGALGLAVAWAALQLFLRTAPVDLPRVNEVSIDVRVVAFAAAVSVLCGLAVATLPAWRTTRKDLEQRLRAGALTTTSDRGGMRVRGALLALQVSLSIMLLAVTGLLGTSFVRLISVDRGFAAERVLLMPLSLPANRYPTETSLVRAYDRLIPAIGAVPGVVTAATISAAPLTGSTQVNAIVATGSSAPRSEQPSANFRFVSPGFFRTMGIVIERGRPFTDAERPPAHAMPALVSTETARRLWPNEDPIGKRFSRGIPGEDGFEVVGVVGDVKLTSLERTPPPMVYLPYWWRSRTTTTLLVQAAGDPSALTSAVRRAIGELDAEIAIGNPRSLVRQVEVSVAARRYQMQLFVAFGAVALFIATLGVYAVTAYGVSQRRREMNIRVALGAPVSRVVGMVVAQGAAPIAAGVGVGAAGALAVGGLVASLLFAVEPRDPLVLGAVVAAVSAAGLAACLIAARQGLVLDPAAALRDE